MATDASNTRRRERYANDPAFRERTLTQNRESARKHSSRRWQELYENDESFRSLQWERHIKNKYGLSVEDYLSMLDEQNGVCAICEHTCASGNRLCVDHCHSTGRVRGLLCAHCNHAIGKLGDDPQVLRRAAGYLEEHA